MNTRLLVPATALALVSLSGCFMTSEGPSGESVTEFHTTTPFTEVELQGVGEVTIVPGDDYCVTITTDATFIDGVTSEVVDGILKLNEDYDFNARDLHVTFLVTVPSLEGVTLTGAGNFTVEGIDAEAFSVTVAGAGDVTVSGSASTAHLRLVGAGNIDAIGLDAAAVEVELLGVGNISVSASDTLDVALNGVGDVTYAGDPEVTSHVAGLGSIRAR